MPDAQKKSDNRPKIEIPDEFDSEREFIEFVRKVFKEDLEFDNDNRTAAIEDTKFMIGDQWDEDVKNLRDNDNKPTLTINHIPAFVGQLIGNRRLNETVIKVVPDHGGTKGIAKVRQGLIRSIQKTSRAIRAYDKAFENQVIGGVGNFQLNVEFANDDVFEQDIKINPIVDAEAVVWDRMSIDPTGADAMHVFVADIIAKEDFEELYPNRNTANFGDMENGSGQISSTIWETSRDIRIVSYWRIRTRKRLLALMTDGDVEDITDEFVEDDNEEKSLPPEILKRIVTREDGEPVMREVDRRFAEMYVLSGDAVLEGPYRLPISRVPVFKASGWEVNVGDKRHRWGLVRFMKDPVRFANFWRSTIAEKIMRSPKARFMASDAAIENYEDLWRKAHLSDETLIWNAEAGVPPKEVPPIQVEPALIQAAQMAVQDLKDVTNIQDASLGIASNEVSGKAILARQKVGELGTILYLDNLNAAIEECGRVINELIPTVYDTPRMVKILSEDEQEELVQINAKDEGSVDVAVGKYAVSIITGPSTATKRIEAAESMLAFMNTMPQAAAVVADLIAEAQDWPGAGKIAQRIRATLPAEVVGQEELSPEQQAAQQAAQEQAQKQTQKADALFEAELAEKNARAREAEARADEAEARAAKIQSEVGVQRDLADAKTDNLDADTDLKDAKTFNETVQRKEPTDDRRERPDDRQQ